ncbi:hypothetical protein [Pantoea sp.]|uniref:hypothetical protein n=1 Tax=Pantoea sp. TaxID=69393 RepID=UPI00289D5970|nr:hypothetical protein [Pantoea sp.]
MNLFANKRELPSLKKMLPAIFLSTLTFSALSAAESGTVTFSGQIVEDICDGSVAGDTPQISCYRDGKWKSQPLSMNTKTEGHLPYNIGKTQLQWIDKAKKIGIMTISYR